MTFDRSLVFFMTTCLVASPLALTAGCSSNDDAKSTTTTTLAAEVSAPKGPAQACVPNESAPVPTDRCTTDATNTKLPQCGVWTKVEIPGTICGDGSQYKFFVNYSNVSNDVMVNFEPGGACWDYASCTGEGGARGAANPHGIPDDHMSEYQYLNLLRRTSDNPVQTYNMIFASYCTGDIHTGDKDAMYTSVGGVDGGPAQTIEFHHNGHKNSVAIAAWIKQNFPVIPKFFMSGCSAGGAGALLNYPFFRSELGAQAQCGYLLDDSGPIFHGDGPSMQLDAKIRDAWNVDGVLADIGSSIPIDTTALQGDYGLVNSDIARAYPHDRLALTLYQMDLNYSLYSYQTFFPGIDEAEVHEYWREDIAKLLPTFDAEPNLAYYLPYFRTDNCSHCVSIPPIGNAPLEPTDDTKVLTQPWLGSDIPEDMIDLKAFTTTLLDDTQPMRSYVQGAVATEAFTPAESMLCFE